MIYITGDTHGDMNRIVRFCERMETSQEDIMVLCQDLAQNKMRSFATKLLTENRPSHTFFQSR